MQSENVHTALRDEAETVLSLLRGVQVPPIGLHHFTVGDRVSDDLLRLESEILELPRSRTALERVLLGNFGTGKTHFLRSLAELLRRDAPRRTAICWVDLGNLNDPVEFEYWVARGMRPLHGTDVSELLRDAYQAVRDKYAQSHVTSRVSFDRAFGVALFQMLSGVTLALASGTISSLLVSDSFWRKAIPIFRGASRAFGHARGRAPSAHVDFVDSYLRLVSTGAVSAGAIDAELRKLSSEHRLIDMILKILSLAGYELVVFVFDELESLSKFDESDRSRALTAIKTFRDTLPNVAAQPDYPPVAVICACTEPFYEQIATYDRGLYDRWQSGARIVLNPLSEADIDNLIFRLRHLYFLAGRRLAPVQSFGDGVHEVIGLRKELLEDVEAGEILTNRQLVTRLLGRIDEASRGGVGLTRQMLTVLPGSQGRTRAVPSRKSSAGRPSASDAR